MKIIQSWIPHKAPGKFNLSKEEAYIIMLSSLLLKKNYGNVTLYTNKVQKYWFEKIGFEYEYNIDVLKDESAEMFAMPKLIAMKTLDEPFIHFDLDTLIFNKPNIDRKSPYIFSHPDMNHLTDTLEILEPEDILNSNPLHALLNNYVSFYIRNKDTFNESEDFPHEEIKISEIPNFNMICVRDDVDIFKKSIDDALVYYELLKKEFDKDYSSSIFLEQFTVNLFLKQNNKKYKKIIEDYTNEQIKIEDSPFLFTRPPVTLPHDTESYPLVIANNQYCTMCKQEHTYDTEFKSEKDLSERFDFSFSNYNHIGGANKLIPFVTALTISHIIKEFGESYAIKVHKFFKEIIRSSELSVGEKRYEEISGNPLFTNLNKKTML